MPFGELGRRMSAAEFREWVAYDAIEPLPDPHWIGAMQAWVMARIWGSKTAAIGDFMPARGREPKRQSVKMHMALMGAFAAQQNARVEGSKKAHG